MESNDDTEDSKARQTKRYNYPEGNSVVGGGGDRGGRSLLPFFVYFAENTIISAFTSEVQFLYTSMFHVPFDYMIHVLTSNIIDSEKFSIRVKIYSSV